MERLEKNFAGILAPTQMATSLFIPFLTDLLQ
jgi:hypothetical protein